MCTKLNVLVVFELTCTLIADILALSCFQPFQINKHRLVYYTYLYIYITQTVSMYCKYNV